MKILFLNTRFFPDVGGGVEVVLRSQARLLQAAGHEVALAVLGASPTPSDPTIDGLRVFRRPHHNLYFPDPTVSRPSWQRMAWHLRDRHNPATRSELSAVLDQFAPEVVWIHSIAGWSISVLEELRRRGIPVVQVLHDQYFLCIRSNMFRGQRLCQARCASCRVLRLGHRAASQTVDAVVGVSAFILDKHREHGVFDAVELQEVLYNVKDGGLPSEAAPPRAEGPFVFGFLGTVTESKGVVPLLEAFTSLDSERTRLKVAGPGKPEFIEQLRARFADPRIEFLGPQPAEAFFRSLDVAVVPSIWNDTLPTVVFEAQACGTPVLGSRRGGIPEMIQPGVNGWLFDPDAPGQLRTAMESVLASTPLDRGPVRDSARRHFDPASWIAGFERISEQCIQARRSGGAVP